MHPFASKNDHKVKGLDVIPNLTLFLVTACFEHGNRLDSGVFSLFVHTKIMSRDRINQQTPDEEEEEQDEWEVLRNHP